MPPVGTSRRELLRLLLGAPVAAAAAGCRSSGRAPARFVDPDLRLGHRLRQPSVDAGGPPREAAARVVILGAGVSGLTAAWRLLRRGIDDVVLLELEPRPGGTALGGRGPVGGYPWAAHYLPAPRADQPELVGLLEEMGVVEGRSPEGQPRYREGALVATPQERVFAGGLWQPGLLPEIGGWPGAGPAVARFRRRMRAFAGLRGSDGKRAFALPIAESSEDPELLALDRLDFATWLEQAGFGHPAVQWLADYATRDDFGATPDRVSAWYGIHYHAARLDPITGGSAPFLTWPEGNHRFVEHFMKHVGDRVRTGRLVHAARPHPSGRGVEVLAATERGSERWSAERAIWALPGFLEGRLLGRSAPAPEASAWLVANLHLRTRPGYRGAETAWDNVIADSRSLGYVVSTHQLGPPAGPTTWTWYLPLTGDDPGRARRDLLALTPDEGAELALSDLERAHPDLRSCVDRIELRRWGHAMAIPTPGSRRGPPLADRGMHFAHADRSAVGLFEEAFHHGLRAADEVARALGGAG